ncbi:MAG: hypothetical protein KC621_00610 [Myxococcales bacterium]|nr:hypothetical protein [Myxococcales bacterium]
MATSTSKVPEVTLGFWVLKILATTLGETGGDAVSMTLDLGYLVGSAIFAALFLVAVVAQVRARSFRPFLYWAVVVATTTLGTTMADFATRSLGIGYAGGTALLVVGLIASLAVWRSVEGVVAVDDVETPRVEAFYWGTILFSQTLGTALGDWVADTPNVGFVGGAVLFGSALAAIALAARFSSISRTVLFWSAFVLTRPLGATLGDLIDKPLESGGYEVDRFVISGALALAMVVGLLLLPQRAGGHPSRHSS